MEILENISLKEYNTFGIDVKTKFFCELKNINDFIELSKNITYHTHPHLILGGGSNILFTKDYDGIILKNSIKGIEVSEETEDFITLKVGSGEIWHNFVLECIRNNWGGIENLSLIPGTVGAAPIQNIGAYGTEVKDTITKVEVIDKKSFTIKNIENKKCEFGYRNSIFKSKEKGAYFISAVYFKLSKKHHTINTRYGAIEDILKKQDIEQPTLQNVSNAIIEIRSSKLPDPKVIGNAGSFFKNPLVDKITFQKFIANHPTAPYYEGDDNHYKIPAGWLIEQCGWKGKIVGNTGSHKDQALVLVNHGNANGKEIQTLAFEIVQSVKNRFDIAIEAEVNII